MKKTLLLLLFGLFMAPAVSAQTKNSEAKTETPAKQNFENIKGNYVSDAYKESVLIFHDGNNLMCKIPGKGSMQLQKKSENTYIAEKEGMTFRFDPESSRVLMTEGDKKYVFSKS